MRRFSGKPAGRPTGRAYVKAFESFDRDAVWKAACAGMPLAGLEMRGLLEELLARTGRFTLAGPVHMSSMPEIGPILSSSEADSCSRQSSWTRFGRIKYAAAAGSTPSLLIYFAVLSKQRTPRGAGLPRAGGKPPRKGTESWGRGEGGRTGAKTRRRRETGRRSTSLKRAQETI